MPAPLILQTQKRRVSGKSLLPNGNLCKLHRGDPAEKVMHSSVSKAVWAACGSFCLMFEHEYFCWMNNTCSGSFFKPGLCCSLMSFLTSYPIGSSMKFIFCTLRYRKSLVFLNIPPDCVMWAFSYHMCPEGKSHGTLPKNIILKSCRWVVYTQPREGSKAVYFSRPLLPSSIPPSRGMRKACSSFCSIPTW